MNRAHRPVEEMSVEELRAEVERLRAVVADSVASLPPPPLPRESRAGLGIAGELLG